jgi:hypothetical protein
MEQSKWRGTAEICQRLQRMVQFLCSKNTVTVCHLLRINGGFPTAINME